MSIPATEVPRALVEDNLGFVVTVARQYRHRGVPFEDLLNAGNLGLVEAARRFDPTRGARFVTYAVWWIRKSILELVSHQSSIVFLPPYQRRLAQQLEREQQETGADGAATPRTRPRRSQPPVSRLKIVSIDAGFDDDERPERHQLRASEAFDPERLLIRDQESHSVRSAYCLLPAREREVIRHRFGLDGAPVLSLQAIGEQMGLSRERVRQIEHAALAHLRARLKPRRFRPVEGRPAARV